MVKQSLITKKVGGKAKNRHPVAKKDQPGAIKTARELGLSAVKLGITKGKTHKGRKILENKAPKIKENPKRSLFMKGRKSSDTINTLMQELHKMRGSDMSKLFTRKSHDVAAFEDPSGIEVLMKKQDCSLFVVGSTQKKRPHNLVLGRTFDGHVLDMFETGVENYKGMKEFKSKGLFSCDMKPILMFQGEAFELSDVHRRLKNLLQDFFKLCDAQEVNIAEMSRVIVFTCYGEKDVIKCQHLEVDAPIDEGKVKNGTLQFNEIGPSFDMRIRRDKVAAHDNFKEACRKPKVRNVEKKNQDKNKFTTVLGDKKGKIFIQQQDLATIALKKYRKMDVKDEKVEAEDV